MRRIKISGKKRPIMNMGRGMGKKTAKEEPRGDGTMTT
jgi:hypothetical protein